MLHQYLADWLSDPVIEQGNLADFLADHIGSIHSGDQHPGGARLSENTDKRFADLLQQKRQQSLIEEDDWERRATSTRRTILTTTTENLSPW